MPQTHGLASVLLSSRKPETHRHRPAGQSGHSTRRVDLQLSCSPPESLPEHWDRCWTELKSVKEPIQSVQTCRVARGSSMILSSAPVDRQGVQSRVLFQPFHREEMSQSVEDLCQCERSRPCRLERRRSVAPRHRLRHLWALRWRASGLEDAASCRRLMRVPALLHQECEEPDRIPIPRSACRQFERNRLQPTAAPLPQRELDRRQHLLWHSAPSDRGH